MVYSSPPKKDLLRFDNHQPVRIPPLDHLSLLPLSVRLAGWLELGGGRQGQGHTHILSERKSYVSLAMAILW